MKFLVLFALVAVSSLETQGALQGSLGIPGVDLGAGIAGGAGVNAIVSRFGQLLGIQTDVLKNIVSGGYNVVDLLRSIITKVVPPVAALAKGILGPVNGTQSDVDLLELIRAAMEGLYKAIVQTVVTSDLRNAGVDDATIINVVSSITELVQVTVKCVDGGLQVNVNCPIDTVRGLLQNLLPPSQLESASNAVLGTLHTILLGTMCGDQ